MAEARRITGYVATQPREVQAQSGREMTVFRVMENHRVFDRDAGEWKDAEPTAYDVAVGRDGLRQNVLASLQKGQRVSIEGSHDVSAYLDRSGNPQVGHRIWATDVSASMLHEPQHRGVEERAVSGPEANVERGPQQQAPQRGGDGQDPMYDEALRYTETTVTTSAAGPQWER